MATQTQSISASRVLLDGFTAHVACLNDVSADDYVHRLTPIAKASFCSLVQALILHDVVLVGRDVIGPSARLTTLFQIFGPALEESPSIPNSLEFQREYECLKKQYNSTDGIDEVYEAGLTTMVQLHCFEGRAFRKVDEKLLPLLIRHSALRTRMYVQLALAKGIPYIPSPYRRRLFNDHAFRKKAQWDCRHRQESRLELLGKVEVRFNSQPPGGTAMKADNTAGADCNYGELVMIPFEVPAFMEMILQNSHGQGILSTARQIRDSKEAQDFRTLLAQLFEADQASIREAADHDLDLLAKRWRAKRTLDGARDMARSGINGFGCPVKKRAAYIFLHNILEPTRPWPNLWRGQSALRRKAQHLASWCTRRSSRRRTFS